MLSSHVKVLLLKYIRSYRAQSNVKVLNASYKCFSGGMCFSHRPLINHRYFWTSAELKEKKVTITFLKWDGTSLTIEFPVGRDVRSSFDADNPEIKDFGQCLGCKECATCHLYFPPDLFKKLPAPDKEEEDLLAYLEEYDPDRSRLGCCVTITEEMDGVIIKVPKTKDLRFRKEDFL